MKTHKLLLALCLCTSIATSLSGMEEKEPKIIEDKKTEFLKEVAVKKMALENIDARDNQGEYNKSVYKALLATEMNAIKKDIGIMEEINKMLLDPKNRNDFLAWHMKTVLAKFNLSGEKL